jgi:hypothetical protein
MPENENIPKENFEEEIPIPKEGRGIQNYFTARSYCPI